VTVEQGTHQGSINCFGCSVVVKGDLDGEITTIGGDVTVYGKVRKDVVTVGGAIHLKNGAEVDADVVAIGGGITTEGTMTAPGKDAFASFPWMHLPGQMSIGWRGALALLVSTRRACCCRSCCCAQPRAEHCPGHSPLVGNRTCRHGNDCCNLVAP